MPWNQDAFEKACSEFKALYPSFQDFENLGGKHLHDEREYREELVRIYDEEVRPLVSDKPLRFVNKYLDLLSRKLDTTGEPQPLIDFGAVINLRKLNNKERKEFGGLLQDVLTAKDTHHALTVYSRKAHASFQERSTSGEQKFTPGEIRAFISLLLMLRNPEKFLYLPITYWQSVGNLLMLDPPAEPGDRLDGDELKRCQEFVNQVQSALDREGFRPHDMLDVQVFLWHMAKYQIAKEKTEGPNPWNQSAFEDACEAFKSRYDGFVDFENSGEKYQSEERAFKEELIALYSENVRPLIDGNPGDFLNAYHDLVNSKLQSRRPKEFKGWRTLGFFENIPEIKRAEFGKALQDLLQASDIFEAFEVYGKRSSQLLQGIAGPGALRICGGLLMTLHRPESFMYAILKVWGESSKMLTGHYTILPPRFTINGEVARACQDLAKQVRNALTEKGWRPRDMLDVQSFLWSIREENLERRRKDREDIEPPPLSPPSRNTLALDEISTRIRAKGMRIDHRMLRRYHSAMRTRGFIILAGPSGTGKTWLASLYASAIGAKSVVAPVAPNWASNEDLLGYFNPIEDKFHATSFLKFIDSAVEAWERDGKDAPEYHLVLDEMNLARIEHYFSLFLSLMERRRETEMPEASMTGRPSIRIPPNLKFVGTVNMDETTHGFADKVFDRAQLIELSIDRASAQEHITQKLEDGPAEALLALWDAMASASPVGFRVLDDIADYLEEARKCGASWQEALDDQVVSKLLPKLRGIDPETSEALKGIADLAKEGQYLLAEAKCKEMLRRYERTDVVSFF